MAGKGNHTAYHIMDNDQAVPPGDYKGKWSYFILELEGNGEVFTDISSKGLNVKVKVHVTSDKIEIHLL